MHLLVVTCWFPYPADNGIKIRISNFLKYFLQVHAVSLVVLTPEPVPEAELAAAQARGFRQVRVLPVPGFKPKNTLSYLQGLFSELPASLHASFSAPAAQVINKIAREADAVIFTELGSLAYIRYACSRPAVLDDPELAIFVDQIRTAKFYIGALRRQLTWLKLKRFLTSSMALAQGCVAVSEEEQANFLKLVPSFENVRVIPNNIDLESLPQNRCTPQPDTIIFSGSFSYPPNLEAVAWFLEQAYPLIKASRPAARFIITGRCDPAQLGGAPLLEDVQFTGFVPDVHPIIAQSWVSIAPVHQGSGTRLKILEAMALGLPVVSTSKGAQGLESIPGKDILIADSGAAFAGEVLKLLASESLRQSLSLNGQNLVKRRYSAQACSADFLNLLAEITRR